MDEVDIDNVDDLNELEARLYAQIHHEATDDTHAITAEQQMGTGEVEVIDINPNNNDAGAGNQNIETSSHTNRILARRYWASGEAVSKQQTYSQQNSKQRFIRNPFKTSNQQNESHLKGLPLPSTPSSSKFQNHHQQLSNQMKNPANVTLNKSKTNDHSKSTPSNSKPQAEKSFPSTADKTTTSASSSVQDAPEQVAASLPTSIENKKNKNVKQKTPADKSNLKLNPVADWMERNKHHNNKKINNNNNVNSKKSNQDAKIQGPFAKQQQKLQKAKRLEDKKQKSKKAKINASKQKISEVISLDTDDDSDSSDVIVIPTVPPPTYTVDDSGDEDVKVNVMEHEENALDSTDVQMSSTSGSFIKPQSLAVNENAEKRLDNSSRCTSPCSIQSSDDFIGQNDRSRLLAGSSGMADDEDLLVLTSDMNSLLEVPEMANQLVMADEKNDGVEKESPLDSSVEQIQEEIMETNDSSEFATPTTSKNASNAKDYRVDQGQFRALDVYESESDITDSVYSKGVNKSTIIRQINTSSDEVEDIGSCSQKTKRLRKRRASSSNKESDPNNDISLSSSDNEEAENDDNDVLRTRIPFVYRGNAVESCKPRKRSRTLSTCSPLLHKRKASKTSVSSGHMSDTEFIATLNTLAQGQEDESVDKEKQDLLEVDEDESETENIPSARDIAEKILAQHNENVESTNEVAVPEDVLNELDKVFETIDEMDKQEIGRKRSSSTPPDTVKISDSSDSDREKNLVYKSMPNEDRETQVIEYSPVKAKFPPKTHADNGSPIYNVIYSRGHRKPGGLGWNDEMRRFYNNIWDGLHFNMNKLLQTMNPDKNLWKIYSEDRFNIKANRRHSNMKCTNCCEFGHMRSKCKRPRKPSICYMCGESGHHEPRCPNTICLRCGNKTQVFTKSCNVCSFQNRLICPICKVRGHSLDHCPDKWRRYHSTTEPNTYPNSSITYNTRKYCCICGGRGHLSDNCRSAVRFMEYPTIVSTIKSHQKSYADVVVKTPHNGIALNLMYDPCQDYKFIIAENTSRNKYYGRFLKSVNLEFLLNKPKKNPLKKTTSESRTKRLSKRYEANPYLKVGTANQQNIDAIEDAPNQVPEISESGNVSEQDNEQNPEQDAISLEDINSVDTAGSDNEVELVGSTVIDDDNEMIDIQLNTTVNQSVANVERPDENFKSPKNKTSTSILNTPKTQAEQFIALDSDSNYSFSEHFDVPSTSVEAIKEIETNRNHLQHDENPKRKPREMEVLPDFIPLSESAEYDPNVPQDDDPIEGISHRFVVDFSDDDDGMAESAVKDLAPLPELPCEAKIYLTHFHSKYFLSPVGNAYLIKSSRSHKLNARLDFTSIGHVLVIFGLPSNQDKFQRELLLKYRELSDESHQKQFQSNLNVPKRTDILIKFLRENIILLLNNLGNVNHLFKRLQAYEKQQSKSGYKLAEKVRKSLNMILIGQAGLKDGTLHLDKLLMSLKTLINDYNNEDVAPPQLRSEITDHWKVIFSPYRHDNYQQLVNAYHRLISKNRMPKLNIDPVLLGHKVLDVSLSEEQKQKLERAPVAPVADMVPVALEAGKQVVPNPLNQKSTKPLKRKQNPILNSSSSSPNTSNTNKAKSNSRPVSPAKSAQTIPSPSEDNNTIVQTSKTKSSTNNSGAHLKANRTLGNSSISVKTKPSTSTTPIANKSKQTQNSTLTNATANATPKKQAHKIMPPPPFANPEKRSAVSTTIQEVSDKWKSTCDTLLTEISSDKPKSTKFNERPHNSKQASTFWSRESMRYLDDCMRFAAGKSNVLDKLQRVQHKSKNGQLSYNDYLAVIKLHTALNGK